VSLPVLSARLYVRVLKGCAGRLEVRCGTRSCGTTVAYVLGRSHRIDFLPGFSNSADGVVRLRPRIMRQWERAKRQGVPWKKFEARGRKPVEGDSWLRVTWEEVEALDAKLGGGHGWRARGTWPGGPAFVAFNTLAARPESCSIGAIFECPVCTRWSKVWLGVECSGPVPCRYCRLPIPLVYGTSMPVTDQA
jgi:hypothetical protein